MWLKIIQYGAIVLVIIGLGAAVYFGFIRPNTKPNPTEVQKADNITNYNYTYDYHPVIGGCMRIPKPDEKK